MINLLKSVLVLYYRPFLFACICFAIHNFSSFFHKVKLTLQGIAYFLFCNDKSWPKKQDPASFFDENQTITRKTIIFVRHGESTWNDTFNKGAHRSGFSFAVGFLPGLVKAIMYEFYLTFLINRIDSWFYDSPLSVLGLNQVEDLAKYINQDPNDPNSSLNSEEKHLLRVIRADDDSPPSVLVSSSLRRSISTVVAAFQDRLRRTEEAILILPSLQEISRNPDTLSITPARTTVVPSWIDESYDKCDLGAIFSKQLDMKYHIGNKPIDTNGYKRMKEFCHVVFSTLNEEYVIVGGHSIWFRSFFKEFLPRDSAHIGKKKKIINCGAVAFDLCRTKGDGMEQFMIDEKTIRVVYGGFK